MTDHLASCNRNIRVIGHRGVAGLLPENTLAGFRLAMDLGVDGVECDVQVTRDGRLVVMHDADVARTTNGVGKIAEMDLQDIGRLDAGGSQRVPTLEELLDLLAGRCHLLCELKADGAADLAAKAVLSRGMQRVVTFISFSLHRLAEVKRCSEDLRIGALCASPTLCDLTGIFSLGVSYVGIQDRGMTPDIVKRIRNAGVVAGAWTPDRLEEMLAMVDMGVTHITTDQPDVLLGHLGRLRVRYPHLADADLLECLART